MERIKEALEKARNGRRESPPDASAHATSAEGISELEIRYSKTRIATVNRGDLRDNRVIFGEQKGPAETAYKMLRTQVLQRMVEHDWNALAITSPALGDGKTITAINLAISLARELHHTVLLVDFDLRNPCISKYFGLNPQYGIEQCLLGDVVLDQVLVNPEIERLVLLPAKNPVDNSSELLASPSMGRLVQELKSRYPSRFVLFDLPPILSADDALSFAPYVDAFLLVLRESKTTRTELQHAVDLLRSTPIVGTVLNGSNERISTYY